MTYSFLARVIILPWYAPFSNEDPSGVTLKSPVLCTAHWAIDSFHSWWPWDASKRRKIRGVHQSQRLGRTKPTTLTKENLIFLFVCPQKNFRKLYHSFCIFRFYFFILCSFCFIPLCYYCFYFFRSVAVIT